MRRACTVLLGLLIVGSLAACDRPGSRTAHAETTRVRETRYVLGPDAPSAIQRVTGAIDARRALEPLDSLLAVRILTNRGAGLAGVAVRWTLPIVHDDTRLRVIDAVTDSGGISRAELAIGATADTQTVVAEVDGVGAIDFRIALRPTAIEVIVPDSVIWPGDSHTITAVLRDDAGRVLTGGRVHWVSGDTAVFEVSTTGAAGARVTGRGAGSADLGASVEIGGAFGRAVVRVRPIISGDLVTIDGGQVPGSFTLRVAGENGALIDTVVAENGRFSRRTVLPADGDIDVDVVPGSPGAFSRARIRVNARRDLQNMRIILVPARWRVDVGTYASREIAIEAAAALHRNSDGSFWRTAPEQIPGPRILVGWSGRDLPLSIAFDRSHSASPISAADSTAFWAIARQMERDLGFAAFTPADWRVGAGIVPIRTAVQSPAGDTRLSWNETGDPFGAEVFFRGSAMLQNPRVVTHELLHVLGFGHATAWATVSKVRGGTEPRLTPADVAYVQLAMTLRRLARETGARLGLPD